MPVVSADVEPLTFVFADDGLVPNNPMPFLVYRGALAINHAHPERSIESLLAQRHLRLSALPCDGA